MVVVHNVVRPRTNTTITIDEPLIADVSTHCLNRFGCVVKKEPHVGLQFSFGQAVENCGLSLNAFSAQVAIAEDRCLDPGQRVLVDVPDAEQIMDSGENNSQSIHERELTVSHEYLRHIGADRGESSMQLTQCPGIVGF